MGSKCSRCDKERSTVYVVLVGSGQVKSYCDECYSVLDKSRTLRLNVSDAELEAKARKLWGEAKETNEWLMGLM